MNSKMKMKMKTDLKELDSIDHQHFRICQVVIVVCSRHGTFQLGCEDHASKERAKKATRERDKREGEGKA